MAPFCIDAHDDVRLAVGEPRAAEALRHRSRCDLRVDPAQQVRPLRASIRVRYPARGATTTVSRSSAIDPLSPATTIGSCRTRVTVSNVGSIRSSVRETSVGLEPTAQRLPASRREALRRPVDRNRRHDPPGGGEIRARALVSGEATQIDPAPNAIAAGRESTETEPRSRALRGVDHGDSFAVHRRGRPARGPARASLREVARAEARHERHRPTEPPPRRRRRGGVGSGCRSRDRGGQVRVVSQDRLLEAAQLGAGFDPELVAPVSAGRRDSAQARRPVDRCGRGLSSTGGSRLLVERFGRDGALQVGNELVVLAEREGHVEALRPGGATLVVESRCCRAGLRLELDVGQRVARAKGRAPGRMPSRLVELVCGDRRARGAEKLGEACGVQLAGVTLDRVPRRTGRRSPTRRRTRPEGVTRTRAPCGARSQARARPRPNRSARRPTRPRRHGEAGRRPVLVRGDSTSPHVDRRPAPRAAQEPER